MSECRPSGRKRKTAGARRRIACLAAACCLAAGGGGASRPARAASPAALPAPPVAAAVRERPSPLPWRAAGGGDRGYDVTRYDLDLRVDPGERSVAGRVVVALTLAASHPDTLWFDLVDSLVVDTLRWDGVPLPFARGAETVRFVPPAGAAPGDHTVTVVYHGHPPPHGPFHAGLLFRHQGTTPDDPGPPAVAAVSEPVSAHSWWPCRDEPADKARVTLAVTVPDTLQTVAGGRLVASAPAAPGWRRDVWRLGDPVSTYLVSLQVSRYVTWTDTCRAAAGGLPLRFHVFPPDTVTARRILAPTAAMLRFLESVAGPYPFPDDGYGQVTIVWGGAMEHQTCSSLGRFVVAAPDDRFLSVVLHEMAHQWFGDSVTPARWSDIWLNEGFATYAEALWAEHTGGPAAYRAWLRAIGPERHPGLFAGEGILTDPDPILPNLLVYHKGAWVLHMLRWEMGDAAFFTFLREWAAAPPRRHGTATTADLVAAVSAAAGRDLAPFLAPWLETDAVPQLSWSWQELPANSGELLEVNVTQEQATLFRLPLPVRAWGPWGVRDWRWDVAERTGTQRWPVPGRVDSVRIDPDGRLLLAQGPLPPPAITAGPPYPQPAGADGTLLRFTVHRGGPVTITLHDARGRELGRWPLGELAARPEPYRWHWNGTDGAGRPVPDGVYWLAIRWPDGRRACRVTLLR